MEVERSTMKTTSMLSARAMMMLMTSNSALRDNKVVNEPAPAIKGNTNGTMKEVSAGLSSLKMRMSRIISMAMIRMMRAPATAKEETSTLNSLRMPSPTKRNSVRMARETRLTFRGLRSPLRSLRSRMTGMEPVISMMANKTTKALAISVKLTFMTRYVWVFRQLTI